MTNQVDIERRNHLSAVEAVKHAWVDYGSDKEGHAEFRARLREAKPALAHALDRLILEG